MKKHIYFITLFLIISGFTFGQSQRLVLLEHFTQASCGPCATYNPAINTMLNQNPDKFTAVMYHTSWPGYDPMYNHNTIDNGARTTYYGVNSVPNSVLDGNVYNGHPNGWNISTVNNRYAVPSPFDIQIHHELSPDQSIIYTNMLIHATEDASFDMKAYLAVIEKHIHFNNPPGSNGETDFYNVLKKLVPTKSGIILPAFEADDYMIIQTEWEHQNVYEEDELATIGFIQRTNNKEIQQAANSSTNALTPLHANDAEILEINNISVYNCLGVLHPVVTIRNNGSENLTSLSLHYSVNGGDEMTHQWTGNLGFLDKEEIQLDEISFEILDENTLEVSSDATNGIGDDYVKNDVLLHNFAEAIHTSDQIRLVIITDQAPEETTWEVINSTGEVILSGGPYTDPGTLHQEYYDVPVADCYKFIIYDSGNNGLCCENGTGAWGLYDADGNVELATGGIFANRDSVNFERGGFTGITQKSVNHEISVFPNPTNHSTNISLTLKKDESIRYSLFNLLGETIKTYDYGILKPGNSNLPINLAEINPGVYYLNISIGNAVYTEKLILSK
ncbi:MAG: T9SS type A sorting domain-containing protein [Bacteroidales bacterium]|nr:T9SS type A sorting domain-containing protein [Bacteroidales bacterium]MCF8403643.1 T9SS type A sorting domain-containing protein [Bacteroidales bacterium]